MFRNIPAIAGLAAMIATLAAATVVSFGTLVQASAPAVAERSDLADVSSDCELRDWPYYRTGCLRDTSKNAGRATPARLVTDDFHRADLNRLAEHSPSPRAIERANELSSAQRLKAASHRIAREAVADNSQASFHWKMSEHDLRRIVAAGDFVRRTVR